VPEPHTFDAYRKNETGVSAFSYGPHECLAKDVALTFMTGLVKLVADLKQLRPAPGEMGKVKTIRVGSEKAYLNDSWSYLGFDASSEFNPYNVTVVTKSHETNGTNSLETTFRRPWGGNL
jgi:linoleate 10R-lipoxygenase